MASSTKRLLLAVAILFGILSTSASARPCKTFFIASYSIQFNPHNRNPNSDNPAGFVTVLSEIRQFNPHRPLIFLDRPILPSIDDQEQQQHVVHESKLPVLPFEYDFSSLRERTRDILSVVAALLFGVGCGSLTAVTMYLVWSLFPNRHDRNSFEEFYDVDDKDDLSPKKMGYEKIPAKEAA